LEERDVEVEVLRRELADVKGSLKRLQPLVDNLPRTIKALKELKKLKKK